MPVDFSFLKGRPFATVRMQFYIDSMVAGFLVGYLESDGDYMKALRMGIAAGSASAFSQELATREEVLKLCKSMDSKN